MDVLTLQNEIQQLPSHLQDRIAAFLTALRMNRDGDQCELQQRLDDPSPENWKPWDEVKAGLRSHDPASE